MATGWGIGTGITLLVIGAILSFAVSDAVPGVALGTIGYICMGAGVLSLVIGLIMYSRATSARGARVVERRDDVV